MQALAGYLLQRQYGYEDLREGGFALLKKQKKLAYILELEDMAQAREIFQKYQKNRGRITKSCCWSINIVIGAVW